MLELIMLIDGLYCMLSHKQHYLKPLLHLIHIFIINIIIISSSSSGSGVVVVEVVVIIDIIF